MDKCLEINQIIIKIQQYINISKIHLLSDIIIRNDAGKFVQHVERVTF